jgi:hypothetical protein
MLAGAVGLLVLCCLSSRLTQHIRGNECPGARVAGETMKTRGLKKNMFIPVYRPEDRLGVVRVCGDSAAAHCVSSSSVDSERTTDEAAAPGLRPEGDHVGASGTAWEVLAAPRKPKGSRLAAAATAAGMSSGSDFVGGGAWCLRRFAGGGVSPIIELMRSGQLAALRRLIAASVRGPNGRRGSGSGRPLPGDFFGGSGDPDSGEATPQGVSLCGSRRKM